MAAAEATHLAPLVERVHLRILPDRRLAAEPAVTFHPYVETRSTAVLENGRLRLKLSDHLRDAPDAVLEGVVSVLLCRLHGVSERRADTSALEAYREHVSTDRIEERRTHSRRSRGRKVLDPVGDHRSLLESYLRVTLDLDLHVPQAPRLGWSPRRSRTRFGHYDHAHHCIVVSRVLDDPRVPEWVLDHVMHHEVLHILHPVERATNGRRRVHHAAFREAEARFPRLAEADAWLRRIASGQAP